MNRPVIGSTPLDSSAVVTFQDESIRALLLQIARSLVPGDDTITVDVSHEGQLSTATVMIAPEHLGRLVGEQGRIARSIRTILTAVAMTSQQRYTLDIRATG